MAAATFETGLSVLRDCVFRDCPGDAVLMQERVNISESPEPPPVLMMHGCKLINNVLGINFCCGSGLLVSNEFVGNASQGMVVTYVATNKTLTFVGNKFSNKGMGLSRSDLTVMGRTLYNDSIVVRDDNVFSVEPIILSDAFTSSFRKSAIEYCSKMGMR